MQALDMINFKAMLAELYSYPSTLRIMYSVVPRTEQGISLNDEQFYFYGQKLNLSTKPQLLRLFSAFLDSHGFVCSREKLFARIFAVDITKISQRQAESFNKNLLKALSRARKETKSLHSIDGSRIEWFVYDKPAGNWGLFRLHCNETSSSLAETSEPPFNPKDWEDWNENF